MHLLHLLHVSRDGVACVHLATYISVLGVLGYLLVGETGDLALRAETRFHSGTGRVSHSSRSNKHSKMVVISFKNTSLSTLSHWYEANN